MPKALSATVPEALEARAREIARRENRARPCVSPFAKGTIPASAGEPFEAAAYLTQYIAASSIAVTLACVVTTTSPVAAPAPVYC
jgi:hypothetical protein